MVVIEKAAVQREQKSRENVQTIKKSPSLRRLYLFYSELNTAGSVLWF